MLNIFISLLLTISHSNAQDLSLPEINYGKDGIVIQHAPSNFVMKTRFRIQTRATYEDYDTENTHKEDVTDFNVRRMRLRFDGNAGDPRLLYKVQLSFTRGDMDFDNTTYPGILRDAVVGWKLTDKSTIWLGQTKLPGNRQRVISSGNQELVDRSLLNATFNIDRDMGVQLYHQFGDIAPLWLKFALSNGEGRANNNKNNGLAYTARLEWLPLGKFTDDGDYFEGDLAHETTPKLSLGVVYNSNRGTNRSGGQIGKTFTSGTSTAITRNMETYFADILFKYQGWAFSGEYARRQTSDNPIAPISSSKNIAIYKGEGVTAQLSYVMNHQLSPVVRFTQLFPEDDILSEESAKTQYTVGLTQYYNQHKIKLQGDITYEKEKNKLDDTNFDNWSARIQLEVGI